MDLDRHPGINSPYTWGGDPSGTGGSIQIYVYTGIKLYSSDRETDTLTYMGWQINAITQGRDHAAPWAARLT